MDFITINGDEPRLSEFFALARLGNQMYQADGLDWFVSPVKVVNEADLQMQVIRDDEYTLLTYEQMFDLVWPAFYADREVAEMQISLLAEASRN